MIVNPGIRRFLGSAIQRLFNSASFYAPLTHSLVLERGTGSPSFTRASTATFRDWEGVLRTVPSGCARFEGARMVRNLTKTNSEDFGVAFTTVNGGNSASGTTLTFAGGLNTYILQSNNTGIIAGRTYCYSVYLKAGTKAGTIKFGNQTNGEFSAPITPTATLTRYQFTNISAGPGFVGFVNSTADTGTVIAERFQIEDVTGQADQTASEYVSVGQLSAPYHGAGVDGVEFFNTDRDGAVIPAATNTGYLAEGARTNLCLQSNAFTTAPWANGNTPSATQNVIGPDGATSAWTMTDDSAVALEFVTQNIVLTAATYTASILVKKTTGAQTSYPVLAFYPGVAAMAICTIDTSNGVATAWTAYTGFTIASGLTASCVSYDANFWRVSMTFTGTAATWKFEPVCAGTTNATQSSGVMDVAAQGSAVFYGAQVELGSFASSYIPTTTIAVTRNADVLTYSSAGNIDGTKGWCYAEAATQWLNSGAGGERLLSARNGGANIIPLYNVSPIGMFDGTGSVSGPAFTGAVTPTKFCSTWLASGTKAVAKSGTVGAANACATGGVEANVGVGCDPDGTDNFFGTIRNVRIGQRQLSSSELQAVTR